MKKLLILAVAAIMSLVSCTKEDQLIGTWELTTVQAEGITVDAKTYGLDITITFTAGGVVTMTQDGYTAEGTYAVAGNTLILDDESFAFTLEGKTLTLTVTEDGETLAMIFTKK